MWMVASKKVSGDGLASAARSTFFQPRVQRYDEATVSRRRSMSNVVPETSSSTGIRSLCCWISPSMWALVSSPRLRGVSTPMFGTSNSRW